MEKNTAILVSIVVIGLVTAIGITWTYRDNVTTQQTSTNGKLSAGLRVFDPDDINEIVPRSSDIFVGRVLKQIGTQNTRGFIDTQFSVEILNTLKGESKGTVTVNQSGGMVGDSWEISDTKFDGRGNARDTSKLDEYLLKSGKTYLFIAIVLPQSGWYGLYHSPQARTELDIALDSTAEEVQMIMSKNEQVRKVETILEKSR